MKTNKSKLPVDQDGKNYEDYIRRMGLINPVSGHYVDNKQLYQHMVEYCEKRDKALAQGLPKPQLDDFISECIIKIATRLSFSHNFINYSYRQDMIGDAIVNCLTYIDNFDPKKSTNAFSYITQTCHCAFIRRIKLEKKNNVIKGRYMMLSDISDDVQFDDDCDARQIAATQSMVHTYMELAQEEEDKRNAAKQAKLKEKQDKLNNTLLSRFFQ